MHPIGGHGLILPGEFLGVALIPTYGVTGRRHSLVLTQSQSVCPTSTTRTAGSLASREAGSHAMRRWRADRALSSPRTDAMAKKSDGIAAPKPMEIRLGEPEPDTLQAFKPADEIEGMLAAQHHAWME